MAGLLEDRKIGSRAWKDSQERRRLYESCSLKPTTPEQITWIPLCQMSEKFIVSYSKFILVSPAAVYEESDRQARF